jgi:Tol biopolymer transport system component
MLRKLRDDATGAVPSPDGLRIAFVAGHSIWLMSSEGSDAKEVFSIEKGYSFEDLEWSPDGHRLAYMKRHGEYDAVTIESLALTGGEPVLAISNPRLRAFVWAPNGRIFYSQMESSKEASANIWELAIDPSTSRPSGAPQKLTNWAGFSLWSLTTTADSKRVSFVRKNDQSDVYVGELSTNGLQFRLPARLTHDDRMDWLGSWTRQGNTLLFFSDRNGNFDIFEQAGNQPVAKEIAVGQAEEKRNPQLSPDDRWILYLAFENQKGDKLPTSGRLMRVPASGGAPEFVAHVNGYPGSARMPRERWLPTARGYPDFRCPAASVSQSPCVLAEVKGDHVVFSAFDPLRGRERVLASIDIDPIGSFWDLSPDGSRVAFGKCESGDSHIRIMDLVSKEESQVTVQRLACLTSVVWSPDGRSFFASTWASRGGSLLHILPSGEMNVLYRAAGMSLEKPVPSPDSRFLAYDEVTTIGNAWMLEAP